MEEARRLAGHSGRVAVADLPLVLDAEQAAEMAEVWLFEAWAARERAAFSLPPSRLALEPGDIVSFAADGRSRLLRITEIGEHGARDVEARGIDPDVYTGSPPAPRPRAHRPAASSSASRSCCSSTCRCSPAASRRTPATSPPSRAPGPAPSPSTARRKSSNFLLKAVAVAPAVTGVTLDALPAGPISRLDRASRFRVRLDGGALGSATELALLAGANIAAIENADGEWEVLQFQSAVLTAPSTYELSLLLRGQAGTEGAMRTPVAAGARFVLLDGALARVDMGPDEVGLAYTWRCGPANRNIGDASYLETTHAFRGLGLRPLSPMHVRGSRSGGDLALSWVRRTRIGGDSWDSVEVPLAEETERYEVDILDGPDVVRTISQQHAVPHLHRRRADRRLRRSPVLDRARASTSSAPSSAAAPPTPPRCNAFPEAAPRPSGTFPAKGPRPCPLPTSQSPTCRPRTTRHPHPQVVGPIPHHLGHDHHHTVDRRPHPRPRARHQHRRRARSASSATTSCSSPRPSAELQAPPWPSGAGFAPPQPIERRPFTLSL